MTLHSRRRFLGLAAGSAGAAVAMTSLPDAIARALAIPAVSGTGTIADVEHVVIFMQENRSFDHYYGSLKGVRGFRDRFPITLPSGKSVWNQPRKGDRSKVVTPFRLDTETTSAQCIGDLHHDWVSTHGAINGGRYDRWPEMKTDMTMGYHTRDDLPFHYALADAFTICDQYFCSIPSETHPNRLYLMTGMVDPTGAGGGPAIDNHDPVVYPNLPPYTWTTFPERLEAAGISWQLYQQGLKWDDDLNGNYGLNVLACFQQYLDAKPGSSLHDRGNSVRTLDQLKSDVESGNLPQVSWIIPPPDFCEHPKFMPLYGAQYTARILEALTSNPETWSKTVLFMMYDENDGFFDHIVSPQPPMSRKEGLSTVSIEGEKHDVVTPVQKEKYTADNLPYGLGVRVPMTVISPWSKGGWVNSQVFDHTSVIRFVETRFGVHEPNLTEWRRTVCGDLTGTLDFSGSDAAMPSLPDTAQYRTIADEQCKTLVKPAPPDVASEVLPVQEPGVRPARPLPYELLVDCSVDTAKRKCGIRFQNAGTQGASFTVYGDGGKGGPWRYTVGAKQQLADTWSPPGSTDTYDLAVYGPNGFFRHFVGSFAPSMANLIEVRVKYDAGAAVLTIANRSKESAHATIADNAYGQAARSYPIPAGKQIEDRFDLAHSSRWYDLTVSLKGDDRFRQRFAGHVETGQASTSDPALA